MTKPGMRGWTSRALLAPLFLLVAVVGSVLSVSLAEATPAVTVTCTASGKTLQVEVTSGSTSQGTPLSISASGGDWSIAAGTSNCSGTYPFSTYTSGLALQASSNQYVLVDDSDGELASQAAGCSPPISTSGLTGSSNTLAVDGVAAPANASDATIALGSTGLTPSEAAGCPSPQIALSGIQSLVLTGEASNSALDLSGAPGSLTVDASQSPGTITGFTGTTITFTGESAVKGPSAGSTTFKAGTTNLAITGQGSANTLDLSALSSPVVNASGSSVQGQLNDTAVAGGTEISFSGISSFVGSSTGDTTFDAPASSASFTGQGSGNDLDLSALATSPSEPLTVNVSGSPANSQANNTAVTGATTETFIGISTLQGSSSGSTTFLAGEGGLTFVGQGSDNVLDASNLLTSSSAPATIDAEGGTLSSASVSESFSGISSFIGSAQGYTTFDAPSTSAGFTGQGTGNELDLSALSEPLTVNVSGSTASNQQNNTAETDTATDTFIGITTLRGSSSGDTTFLGGASGWTLDGQGSGNKLSFADFSASGPMAINASTGNVTGSSTSESFSGISSFVGPDGGDTTFTAGPDSSSFTGQGSGNELDMSDLSGPLTVNADTGNASGDGVSDTFGGMSTFVGSSSGDTTFVSPTTSATFNGEGSGNELDLSALSGSASEPVVVNVSGGLVNGKAENTAVAGETSEQFRDISTLLGSSGGNTTFLAGDSGLTLKGQGSNNVLDASGLSTSPSAPATIDAASATPTLSDGSLSDSFSGISSFIGSGQGYTTFDAPNSSASFTGQGSGNALDLSDLGGAPTVNVQAGTASSDGVSDTFTGMTQLTGASGGNTTFVPANDVTLTGQGSGNELDLSSVSGFSELRVAMSATSACGQSPAGELTSSGGSSPLSDSFCDLNTIDGSSAVPTTFVPDADATTSTGTEFIGHDSASGGSVIDLSGITSPDSGDHTVSDLELSLNADTTGSPGQVTADVASTPVTFASFAGINEAIGSSSLSTGFDPGTASGVKLVNITAAPQSVTFTSTPASLARVGKSYRPTATGGGSGNPVLITVDSSSGSGVCSISGGVVSFTAPGTCVIDANQAGDDEYQAASQKQQTISVHSATASEIRALLRSEITPASGTTISTLLSHRGETISFRSLAAGKAAITWYWLPQGAHLTATSARAKPVTVARGKLTLGSAKTGKLGLKLTKAGRKLLAHLRHVKLTSAGTFTPRGGSEVSVTRTFKLRR